MIEQPASTVFGQEATSIDQFVLRNDFPELLKGKRILLATESLGPVNGVSRTTLSLITHLRDNGVNVAVVAPRYKEAKPRPWSKTNPEIRLHGYPLPYNPDLTVAYPFRFDRVCARTFQPDIVYLASPASVGFQFLVQIRQLEEPPMVALNFQTDLAAYSEILFPGPMRRFAVWLLQVVQGFLFSHKAVHTIFYPSRPIRDYIVQAGAPEQKLVHLGRGVNTDQFNPSFRDEEYRKQIAPNGEIILVCVGRIAPEKGFEFLAKVAQRLIDEKLDFKLLIVGGNKNACVEEEVHGYFEALKDRVIFTGFKTGDDLAREYAAGDVFLHCSITETFGLVVLEAMASGLPVIARDQGGPSEIVKHEQTGFLVAPDDLDTFVSDVHRLSNDTQLRNTYAAAARKYALQTTWDKINQRVAWHLADGLSKQIAAKAQEKPRPIRNFLWALWYEMKMKFLIPLIVMFRTNAAIGMVFVIWLIAVIPLLVHGNSAFPGMGRATGSVSSLFRQLFFKISQ